MSIKKERVLIIILAVTLMVVFAAIIFTLITVEPPEQPIDEQIPSPIVTSISPRVKYDKTAELQLLDRKENRKILSDSDIAVKNKIINLSQNPEIVYEAQNIRIRYISSLNLFKIEILTVDVATAKTEGYTWFRSQGMSHEGICNYPVEFYLSYEVADILKSSNFIFSSVPEGC